MERLRPRNRPLFTGFMKTEIEKMEKMLEESEELFLNEQFCRKLIKNFNRSSVRAGKPPVNWTEVHNWFQSRMQNIPKASPNDSTLPKEPSNQSESFEIPQGNKIQDLSDLEFEAKSSKDGAWYDVDTILTHRYLNSGETEAEVLVRFVGFGADEDEWVNVREAIRERSIPFEPTECYKVKVGDCLLCFQERKDHATHYDAHIIEIERKMHDIRGCRCIFSVRYDHDKSEERVRLRRLCHRPSY